MSVRYCLAVFVGAFLLFVVQPMCAKMVLPLLGGTPAAWTTCMAFFQAALLAGYAYAHYLPSRVGIGRHAALHVGALALAAWTLPITLPERVPAGWPPVLWLLAALTASVGLPFVLVSATAPLLQRWYVHTDGAAPRDPYFLYAASNLGSFAGLFSYPLLVEPGLGLSGQAWSWLAGYVVLLVLTALCFPWAAWRRPAADTAPAAGAAESRGRRWRRRLHWVALAMVPCSLMLSITAYLTTDIAPVPLLWVIPFGVYLLTYVLAFSGRVIVPHAVVLRWLPLAVLVAVVVRLLEANDPLLAVLVIHLLVLFWLALACHGELARDRPPPDRLTEFYLCLAIGGAAGGLFNGLVAPLIFDRLTEYPLMLVLAALLCGLRGAGRPTRNDLIWVAVVGAFTAWLIANHRRDHFGFLSVRQVQIAVFFGLPLFVTYLFHNRVWRFVLCLSAVLLASTLYQGVHGTPVYRDRSFFGVHLVADEGGWRRLVHGGTVHGMESLKPGEEGIPRTYYHPSGPIGQVMHALDGDPRLDRVGLVGLGAGSLASYSRPGQRWTFFEIDPAVITIGGDARLFTFLPRARGSVDVVEGDGRLQLDQSAERFGLIVLDAFGSDAIPLHLLTREAFAVYRGRLRPDGLIAVHISNNYLDLEPVLANLADDAEPRWRCIVRSDHVTAAEQQATGRFPSVWALLAPRRDAFPPGLRGGQWRPAQAREDVPVWTDQYSNIWQVFRVQGPEP